MHSWRFCIFYGIFGRIWRKVKGHRCKNNLFTRTTVLTGVEALCGVLAKRRRKEEWKHPYFAFDGLNDRAEGRISQLEPAWLGSTKSNCQTTKVPFSTAESDNSARTAETEKMRRCFLTWSSLQSLIIVNICSSVLFTLFIFMPCSDALWAGAWYSTAVTSIWKIY